MPENNIENFQRFAQKFFLDWNSRLYWRDPMSKHKLVVKKMKRLFMLRAAHDALGHRGAYATKMLISERFWWPEIDSDVKWYVQTCHECQGHSKIMLRIPPMVTHTPSIFETIHIDTMHMTPASNGCKYIVHGQCGLSSWMEGRSLKKDNHKTIAQWLFEDVIC
jgi:hypothetical protein